VDSEELRAHPHHSFTLEGDVLVQLADQQLIRVRLGFGVCLAALPRWTGVKS
jgi:hypothetical protein